VYFSTKLRTGHLQNLPKKKTSYRLNQVEKSGFRMRKPTSDSTTLHHKDIAPKARVYMMMNNGC
jgi:hypothetical protein